MTKKTTAIKATCCLPSMIIKSNDTEPNTISIMPRTTNHDAQMIELNGGWFQMGAADGPHPQDGEGPQREVFVDAFSLSAKAVTIAEFSKFVEATNYVTLAERAGSSFVFHLFCDQNKVFQAPTQAPWWRQVEGACWHSPFGEGSDISQIIDHPVTHIAREDSLAFSQWTNTRLPYEAEWEFAGRAGMVSKPFPWGGQLEQDGKQSCNIWQGDFPNQHNNGERFIGTMPVTAFEPNAFGFYNMTGNVWEWVDDRFTNLHSPRPVRNPKGPLNGASYVARGGSYLCHASYCERYRTSSRQALSPETTTGNLGFRVARDLP